MIYLNDALAFVLINRIIEENAFTCMRPLKIYS